MVILVVEFSIRGAKLLILKKVSDTSVKKNLRGWVGFQESYDIFRVSRGKCLCPITRWVGGMKKGLKHAYVIFEWSLTYILLQKQIGKIFQAYLLRI